MEHVPPNPVGLYEPFTNHGGMFLSAISSAEDGQLITGKVGADVDFDTARAAAERAAKNLLAVLLDAAGGDPRKIVRLPMVRGHVNATHDFARVHKVIDAASELLISELGQKGQTRAPRLVARRCPTTIASRSKPSPSCRPDAALL